MKKKLICLTLSVLMLLSCLLTGCSQSTEDEDGADEAVDNSAKTITMWLMSPNIEDIVDEVLGARKDGQTDEERYAEARQLVALGQARVAEQFTEITKSLYKTNVVLKFCEEDEYYEKLETSITALVKAEELKEEADKALRVYLAANSGSGLSRAELTAKFYEENPQYSDYQEDEEEDDEEVQTEEETVVDDYGIASIKYPDAKANQVDIFYLGGRAKYYEYYQSEWLASLDEELSASSNKLHQYVSPSLLDGVRIDGAVYGIPNNVAVGEYTYMLIDKEIYDGTYNSGVEQVSTVLDLSTFLNDVKTIYGAGNEKYPQGVVPLASTFEECLRMLVWFWELDYVDASVYETRFHAENGRNYVLVDKNKYDGQKSDTYAPVPMAGVVYKTNDDGQFVDKDGNALKYSYAFDAEGGYLRGTDKYRTDDSTLKTVSMYLVDEEGNPVTPENDKRVVLYDSSVEATENGDKTSLSILNYLGEEVVLTLPTAQVEFSDPEDGLTIVDANGNPKPTYHYTYNTESNFSILGQTMLEAAERSRGEISLNFNSLFTKTAFLETYKTLKSYEYNDLFGTPAEGQFAAVSFLKGDAQIKQEAEREDKASGKEKGVYTLNGRSYYVVVAENPEASEKELYGNMFCVYGESNYVNRSMEVITRINTNQELRNLLQYGVLGEHYELNADGTAHPLAGSQEYGAYRMDIEKTGNCFMATPHEDDGPDAWTYAKIQNNDALISPLLGFDFTAELLDSENTLDVSLIRTIKQMSQSALEGINACETMEALEELLEKEDDDDSYKAKYSTTSKVLTASEKSALKKALDSAYDPSMPLGPESTEEQAPDLNGESPFTVYYRWMTNYGYLPAVASN